MSQSVCHSSLYQVGSLSHNVEVSSSIRDSLLFDFDIVFFVHHNKLGYENEAFCFCECLFWRVPGNIVARLANTVGAAESVLRVAATGHDKRLFLKASSVFFFHLLGYYITVEEILWMPFTDVYVIWLTFCRILSLFFNAIIRHGSTYWQTSKLYCCSIGMFLTFRSWSLYISWQLWDGSYPVWPSLMRVSIYSFPSVKTIHYGNW